MPQDWDSLYNATMESHPPPHRHGAPEGGWPGPGKTVVFVIPDIVKGGATSPPPTGRWPSGPALDELYAAGVEKKDILLLFSNGLHPRATVAEMQTILGPELFNEFYPSGQITSHDSEDYDHLVDLGYTAQGDHVIMNKYVYDADIAILIGHTQGNPLRRLLRRLQALRHRYLPLAQHLRPPCAPGDAPSGLRARVHQQRDAAQVRPAGHADGREDGQEVLLLRRGAGQPSPRQIEINSGWAKEMQPISWKMADKRTYVHWAEKKYDIIVFGMPTNFHLRATAWAPTPSR